MKTAKEWGFSPHLWPEPYWYRDDCECCIKLIINGETGVVSFRGSFDMERGNKRAPELFPTFDEAAAYIVPLACEYWGVEP